MYTEQLDTIHDSLVNGQRKQMVKQIDDYEGGVYDFFSDYKEYLDGFYGPQACFDYFTDVTISYFRIKNR